MMTVKRVALLVAVATLVFVVVESLVPPGPPRSTLSFGGETQKGEMGPSCWVEKRWLGPTGACASAASEVPPVPAAPIAGTAGTPMEFALGGKNPPTELQVIAYPFEATERDDDLGREEPRRIFLPARRSQDGGVIRADLPPGEYAVRVAVTVAGDGKVLTGEASYGFHVVVEQAR
jgi:hypothetical protein